MQFSPLELDVLEWIAQHSNDRALARQLAVAQAVERRFTGVGSFTKIRLPSSVPRVTFRESSILPLISSPQLQSSGGAAALLFEDGLAETLEIYSFSGHFPKRMKVYTLLPGPSRRPQ
jgi:hypothetical protein